MKIKEWIVCTGCLIAFSCNEAEKTATETVGKTEATAFQSINSNDFNISFQALLNAYFSLSEALVESNAEKAAEAAGGVSDAAKAVLLTELKEKDTDDIIIPTAQSYLDAINPALDLIKAEKDIEKQRTYYQQVSANLYDLARAVRYDQESIYVLHCPMAFGNQGADWISKAREIRNPYFGDKMLKCGHVKDSLRLSGR